MFQNDLGTIIFTKMENIQKTILYIVHENICINTQVSVSIDINIYRYEGIKNGLNTHQVIIIVIAKGGCLGRRIYF